MCTEAITPFIKSTRCFSDGNPIFDDREGDSPSDASFSLCVTSVTKTVVSQWVTGSARQNDTEDGNSV